MSSVTLIGVTAPRIEGVDSAEELVAYAARVSNPSNQLNSGTSSKLLAYLMKHRHWSPFEMVHVLMEINTTRDIGRQILRHRSFSFQEFSQRYALATDLGFECREARMQDPKNRQASNETDDEELANLWTRVQTYVQLEAENAYTWAIDNGIAKEQARVVLPEGMIKSRMYMSGTLRSWIHYCDVRVPIDTQKEHRIIAEQAKAILAKEFPSIASLLETNGKQ